MTRIFSFLFGALLLASAWAIDLPHNGRVTLVSDNGIVLGVGVLEGGSLSLTLEAGAEGFVFLLIEGADGTIVSLEALMTATGQVLLTGEGRVEDLVAAVVAAGGKAELAFEDRIAQGVDITSLPQSAQDGIAEAIANHEEAMEKAEAGRGHAGGNGPDTGDEPEEDTDEGDEEGPQPAPEAGERPDRP